MDERFSRSERLFGKDGMERLSQARVLVFGLGGVGGAAAEALVRAGIGTLGLVDRDTVDITNLNRQLFALEDTVGLPKTEAAAKRAFAINPEIKLEKYPLFYLPETAEQIALSSYDYIIDAIDCVTAKIELITRAAASGVPVVSSMGTGNKVHPELLEISDIKKTSVCPLARVVRRELRQRGVEHLTVVYSKEEPLPTREGGSVPGSVSFVPPVAGYLCASVVIRGLLGLS